MEIKVSWGTGEGLTELAAFDRALHNSGIANYNLIKLSSVIPENSQIVIEKIDWNQKAHGHKLYVVMSSRNESTTGKEAWAGIGWVTQTNQTGKGLFVEHRGSSEAEVKSLIEKSLESMVKYRPEEYGKINMKLTGIKCEGMPVSAAVCAVYKSEGWC